MKEGLKSVEKVTSFMEVWASLGMPIVDDEDEQLDRIDKYLKHITSSVNAWKVQPLPESKISVPDPSVCYCYY